MNEQPSTSAGPLTGLRVIELGGINGQYRGKLLADMGATVIKVAPPGGDEARRTESGMMMWTPRAWRPPHVAAHHIRAFQEL